MTKIFKQGGRGRKELKCCGGYVAAATERCPKCGTLLITQKRRRSSGGEVPSKTQVEDILIARAMIEEAKAQGKSLEEFVDSIQLSWDVLDNISSMRELKDLQARKRFGSLVERYGRTNTLKLLNTVAEMGS
ncbi:MAG: hypothetical protein KatS3mg111_1409 [Pirellulaceae bacterium]|nr:MAG: hypothetical protein KatS3mg111_1409 [Pirellulaceae bacterium]